MDRGAWQAYSSWGRKELDMTERLNAHLRVHTHTHTLVQLLIIGTPLPHPPTVQELKEGSRDTARGSQDPNPSTLARLCSRLVIGFLARG